MLRGIVPHGGRCFNRRALWKKSRSNNIVLPEACGSSAGCLQSAFCTLRSGGACWPSCCGRITSARRSTRGFAELGKGVSKGTMSTRIAANPAALERGQFGERLTWIRPSGIAVFTIGMIFLHLLLRYLLGMPKTVWQAPLAAALLIGGISLLAPLTRKLLAREFGSDHLAGISIVTSVLLGEYLVGVIVILMLSGGNALEQLASRRASSVLDKLAKRIPQVAHRKVGTDIIDVKLQEIGIGDTIVIFPHEICPVDGVVLEGRGKMDESYLTGEPFEIEKVPGTPV